MPVYVEMKWVNAVRCQAVGNQRWQFILIAFEQSLKSPFLREGNKSSVLKPMMNP